MSIGRYEHAQIKNLIDGYRISPKPLESGEQFFDRAKAELIGQLEKQLKQVKEFGFSDFTKKTK